MPEENLFIHCQYCLRASLDSRLEVSISREAELTIICMRHNITVLRTNDLEGTAEKAYSMGCAVCENGQAHEGH